MDTETTEPTDAATLAVIEPDPVSGTAYVNVAGAPNADGFPGRRMTPDELDALAGALAATAAELRAG